MVVRCSQRAWVVYLASGYYALFRKSRQGDRYLVRHTELLTPYWRKRMSQTITYILSKTPVPLILGDR
jgi:hypothetical protein